MTENQQYSTATTTTQYTAKTKADLAAMLTMMSTKQHP